MLVTAAGTGTGTKHGRYVVRRARRLHLGGAGPAAILPDPPCATPLWRNPPWAKIIRHRPRDLCVAGSVGQLGRCTKITNRRLRSRATLVNGGWRRCHPCRLFHRCSGTAVACWASSTIRRSAVPGVGRHGAGRDRLDVVTTTVGKQGCCCLRPRLVVSAGA